MTVPIGTAMLQETINLSRNCCKKNAGQYLELNAYHKRGKPNACLTDSIALSMTNCSLKITACSINHFPVTH